MRSASFTLSSSPVSKRPALLGLAALGLVSLGLAAAPARAQTQDLFVTNLGTNTILRYAGTGPGTFSTTATALSDPNGSLSGPTGLAFDALGDLFAANVSGNSITEFTFNPTAGTFGAGTVIETGLSEPEGLAVDARGDLFVVNNRSNSIAEFAFNPATGLFGTAQTVETGLSNPTFLAFGPSAPVPEASTTVSLGLLLMLGMGAMVVAARRKKA